MLFDELDLLLEGARVTTQSVGADGPYARLVYARGDDCGAYVGVVVRLG